MTYQDLFNFLSPDEMNKPIVLNLSQQEQGVRRIEKVERTTKNQVCTIEDEEGEEVDQFIPTGTILLVPEFF